MRRRQNIRQLFRGSIGLWLSSSFFSCAWDDTRQDRSDPVKEIGLKVFSSLPYFHKILKSPRYFWLCVLCSQLEQFREVRLQRLRQGSLELFVGGMVFRVMEEVVEKV